MGNQALFCSQNIGKPIENGRDHKMLNFEFMLFLKTHENLWKIMVFRVAETLENK